MSLAASKPPPLADLTSVEQFLYFESRLLDERRFTEWSELFTEDGLYWAPTRHDQKTPEEAVSLFLDDRRTMEARIRRLDHPDIHVQVPVSHTSHMLSNVEIDPAPQEDGTLRVLAAFLMTEFRHTAPRWYAGRYEYRLLGDAPEFHIKLKKVVLVNCTDAFSSMAIYI